MRSCWNERLALPWPLQRIAARRMSAAKGIRVRARLTMTKDKDYVLGTHDEEIARLGLQHRLWRPIVLECWRTAGITAGSRVVDVGAGPGYATLDLAEIVGPMGEVLAVERSTRFLAAAAEACAVRQFSCVRFQEADVMEDEIMAADFDAVWCRWVASFVPEPSTLLARIAKCLRPGGVAIFHEYVDYGTWRLAPRRRAVESFVAEVMESWRAAGGEPDVALLLPPILRGVGLRVIHSVPRVFAVSPRDPWWQWPASFIEINLTRLLELGRVTPEWAESVRQEFREAEDDDSTFLITPMLLEIIARREPGTA
jgi:SAM-dependent methyltransferase